MVSYVMNPNIIELLTLWGQYPTNVRDKPIQADI